MSIYEMLEAHPLATGQDRSVAHLSFLLAQALSQYDVAFAVPVLPLVAFALVAVIAGVLAAVLPARRASRLDVLEALQYE